jgi:hypothetical protein
MIIYGVELYFRFQCGLCCSFTYGVSGQLTVVLQFLEIELANVRFNDGLL